MFGRHLVKSFQNLRQRLITPIKEYFIPRQFKFITLPQQYPTHFKSFPMEQWRLVKRQKQEQSKVMLACLFLMAFFFGDWLYTFKNNENVMYFYFVNYPLLMKLFQSMLKDVENAVEPVAEILPKEKYEVALVWSKIGNLLLKTQQKTKQRDQNVQKLKKQLDQMDKKLI